MVLSQEQLVRILKCNIILQSFLTSFDITHHCKFLQNSGFYSTDDYFVNEKLQVKQILWHTFEVVLNIEKTTECYIVIVLISIDLFLVLGIIGQIKQELYEFLLQLQTQMNKVIKSVGKIDHSLYPFIIQRFPMCGCYFPLVCCWNCQLSNKTVQVYLCTLLWRLTLLFTLLVCAPF